MKKLLVTPALALLFAFAHAEVQPLERSQWPRTVAQAVPEIVKALKPSERAMVMQSSRDDLFLLQGDWGEDIEQLLGLNAGNDALLKATCGADCLGKEAAFLLMQAAWDALHSKSV